MILFLPSAILSEELGPGVSYSISISSIGSSICSVIYSSVSATANPVIPPNQFFIQSMLTINPPVIRFVCLTGFVPPASLAFIFSLSIIIILPFSIFLIVKFLASLGMSMVAL